MTKDINWNKYVARNLANKGRYGDTELLHVNKDELNFLRQHVPLTRNPDTGLDEAFILPLIAALGAGIGAIGTGLGAAGGALAAGAGAVGGGIMSGLGALGGALGLGGGAGAGAAGAGAAGAAPTLAAAGAVPTAAAVAPVAGALPGSAGGAGAGMVAGDVAAGGLAGAGIPAAAPAAGIGAAPSALPAGMVAGDVPLGGLAGAASATPGASTYAPGIAGAGSKIGSGLKSTAGFIEKNPMPSLMGLYGIGSILDAATAEDYSPPKGNDYEYEPIGYKEIARMPKYGRASPSGEEFKYFDIETDN